MRILSRLSTIFITLVVAFSIHSQAQAATDLIIRDFKSDITLAIDDSLDITETLAIDFDSLPNKHGIFRIIPMINGRNDTENRDAAITLKSITDESGTAYQYQSIPNNSDRTLTWKIGNPNRTITGLHTYIIHYTVQNVVGKTHDKTTINNDELIWNLNGNFWEIDANRYEATIHFPSSISSANTTITLYSGNQGSTHNLLNATSRWLDQQTLHVVLAHGFKASEGVTVDAIFPNQLVRYSNVPISSNNTSNTEPLSAFFKLSLAGALIIPLIVFIICFRLWKRYGRDVRITASIAPEFAAPSNLRPMQLGLINTMGKLKNEFIASTIVDLGVRKVLTIKEVDKKSIFTKKDWHIAVNSEAVKHLLPYEQKIIAPFVDAETLLSEGGKSLATTKNAIVELAKADILNAGYLDSVANDYNKRLGYCAIASFVVGGMFIIPFAFTLSIAGFLSAGIFGLFAYLMPKRTATGLKLEQQIRGFRLYMKTAEKYRQQFFERENMFELLLPYAIAFGLTKEWTRAVGKLDDQFATSYAPMWYVGSTGSDFAIDSFTSSMTNLSSSISAAMAPSSGDGSGGFSGGGGGGGGGGGW